MAKMSLGPVSAYADAVKQGYTGTREQFGKDQANFAANAAQVAENLEESKKVLDGVNGAGAAQVQGIKDTGAAQIEAVQDAGADEVADIETAGAEERAALAEAAEAKTAEVEERIEAKGAAVLATIPENYTETYSRVLRNESRISRNEKRLDNIEKGIMPEKYMEDNTVAYKKSVPVDAGPFVAINKVGGMTRKCTNLIHYPYYATTSTVSGVTFTDNGDGSLTLSGTATDTNIFALWRNDDTPLPAGYYSAVTNDMCVIRLIHADNTETTFTNSVSTINVTKPITKILLLIRSGQTYNGTIYPMLNSGDTALPYEPYFEGLRSAPVTEVRSVGANLVPESRVPSVFTKFATIQVNDILADHIGERITLSFDVKLDKLVAEEWSLSIYTYQDNGVGIANWFTIKPSTQWQRVSFKTSVKDYGIVDPDYIVGKIALYDSNYNTYSIKNMQIVLGDNDLPYTSYREPVIIPIPEAVQALDGYGQSNPDNPEEYNAVVWGDDGKPYYSHKGGVVDGAWVPLAKEEVTDISDLLTEDNYIPVEGGGTVTMLNEYEYAVPSEIAYALKEAE